MNFAIRGAALAAACVALSGCATVVRGGNTNVSVVSEPPGATVKTTTGASCSPTPCSLHVSRKETFTATVSKPGYKDGSFTVSPYLSSDGTIALFGNLIIGGLIGVAVDMTTGAPYDLSPSPASVALESNPYGPMPGGLMPMPVTMPAPPAPLVAYAPAPAERPYYASYAPMPPNANGRVVQIIVLSNGGFAEIHEPGAGQR